MKNSKAIVQNRRNEIMKTIQSEKKVNVLELSDKFKVSPLTIRRDLQYWEDKGAITRGYGNASLIQEFIEDKDYDRKRNQHAIAKKAASYVDDGDVIFINSSSTALMTIDYIKDKHVTIITNNAKAINYTPDHLVTIVATGGEIRYPKNSMTGDFAQSMLNKVIANKCIIGCSGLTEEGISTGLMKETLINQTMLNRTRGTRIVLCDSSKFGIEYSFLYSSFDNIDVLLTDTKADKKIINKIKENYNTEIVTVEPISLFL